MSTLSLGLILLSAAAHVYWNLQVKRSAEPVLYTCWLMLLGAVIATPLALAVAWPPRIPPAAWACVAGTAFFYTAYFLFMARSYQSDDLSRAYPVARGVAPLATAAWGFLFHGENPTPLGWIGILGISLGVLLLAGPELLAGGWRLPGAGLLAAIATGLCISGYAAFDKQGVRYLLPPLYITLTYGLGGVVQTAVLWRGRGWRPFVREARKSGWGLLAAALASLGSYLLVLTVLRTEPVSYVVPVRSFAVLLSVAIGTRILGEQGGRVRMAAAALICAGIAVITLGG